MLPDGPFSTPFLRLTLLEGEEVRNKFAHFVITGCSLQLSQLQAKASSVAQRKSAPNDPK